MVIKGIGCGVYENTLHKYSANLKLLKQTVFKKKKKQQHQILGDEIWKMTITEWGWP